MVQQSARMAGEAVDQARQTNERVGELSKAAARIGDVVELINTIAGQTNLLALNATIEAARAGESGRGFAVVANEVKELAQQTARATEDITAKVASIRGDTACMVEVIREIGEIVTRIDATQIGIASAVEEQTASSHGIGRSATDTATAAASISGGLESVSETTEAARTDADSVASAAAVLAEVTGTLRHSLGQFRT